MESSYGQNAKSGFGGVGGCFDKIHHHHHHHHQNEWKGLDVMDG